MEYDNNIIRNFQTSLKTQILTKTKEIFKIPKKIKRGGTRGSLIFDFLRSKKRNFKDAVPFLFL